MTQSKDILSSAEMGTLSQLFSSIIVLDQDWRIVDASASLRHFLPKLDQAPLLGEVFNFVRPRSIANYTEALDHLGALLLLTSVDDDFAIRGQLVQKKIDGNDRIVFCGAPWLAWMSVNKPEVKLRLQDFAPQDVQLDQLFYISTEARMVADLEALNAELGLAKEEAEAAQAAKNAFFARMSHEMRTPLNGIVSALALMTDQAVEGKQQELLGLASKSSASLMEVINYVLDVSKMESEEAEPELVQFDLRGLIGSVSDIVRARAMEKGLELRSRCEASLQQLYIGDEYRLRQALLNLLTNAIKFTERGFVAIDVSSVEGSEGTVRIEVRDTGEGIDELEHESIFEPFVSESSQGGEGTGLGLDIARRNVNSMGGVIGLTSEPEQGSTFWIELPLKLAKDSAKSAVASEGEYKEGQFVGRVLLVDDNETNLVLGSLILEGMGVTVTQAASGEQAVQLAMGESFDLVLMDISMPGIDGYEATRRIRDWKSREELPIVALSAYASSVQQAESMASGMDGYLTKPIERDRLATALERWLQKEKWSAEKVTQDCVEKTTSSHVDMDTLEGLVRQIGLDNLSTVISKFADEAAKRWLALECASTSKDLAREAHTLGSTCRSFGLPGIADQLGFIENHGKQEMQGEPPGIEETGQALRLGMIELADALDALASANASS
ncbi:MAG: ATP-binding protein [Halioglobus sp.]